jgi:hypothetical protein
LVGAEVGLVEGDAGGGGGGQQLLQGGRDMRLGIAASHQVGADTFQPVVAEFPGDLATAFGSNL